MPRLPKTLSWIAQIVAVVIMGQTLFYKFSGAEESVRIFSELGMEPHGRILIGALELVACILLLIPSSVVFGALLGACLMVGAIIGHITRLGWEGDRLELGTLAIVVLVACLGILFIHRKELPMIKAIHRDKPNRRTK